MFSPLRNENARTMRAVNAPVSGLTPYVRYAKSANAKAKLIEAAAKRRATPRITGSYARSCMFLERNERPPSRPFRPSEK
jgi:hypothetical protein